MPGGRLRRGAPEATRSTGMPARPKCPANVPSGSGGGYGPEPVIEQERERSVLLDFRT